MTGKIFTEEDYQTIVDVSDKTIKGIYFGSTPVGIFWEKLLDSRVGEKFLLATYGKEIMAIANPLTREWAHEKFVEKEKYYKWRLKNKKDSDGDSVFITKSGFDVIRTGSFTNNQIKNGVVKFFTESEIREWGYNPDMFDREEVE
jgi:hypothetical protein